MSEQSNKVKGVRATVISVNRSGWATARVTSRATNHSGVSVALSDTISIMAKFGFRRGDEVRCTVVPPKRSSRGSETWFAIAAQPYVARESQMSWAPWQDGKKNLVQSIPDTAPGSDHTGIGFACWRCGNGIVPPEHIHRIKSTAVWTNTAELSGIIIDEEVRHNKWKRCDIQNVRCLKCRCDFGTFYLEPYYDSDTGGLRSEAEQVFPCIKVTTNRELKDGDTLDIVAVLSGDDQGVVMDAIAQLQPSAEWASLKHLATGGRVDADVHRMRQQAIRARDREAETEAAAVTAAARANARARREAEQAEHQAAAASAEAEAAIAEAEQRRRQEARRAEAQARLAECERVRSERSAAEAMQERRVSEELRQAAADLHVGRRQAEADADNLAEQLAGVQLGCGDLIWECEIDGSIWAAFDKDVSALLERANRTHHMGGAPELDFTRDGTDYVADFARMTQRRVGTGVERSIRRMHKADEVVSTISCKEELRVAGPALGLPDVNRVIRQIDQRLAAGGVGPGGAEYDHRFAFFLYTMPDCFTLFNEALRDRSGSRFDAWSPIRWHLNQALAAQPDVAVDVLRGMEVPNIAEYTTDKRIHWSGFSSSTTMPDIARAFAGAGVIFKLKVQNAKDIRAFSWFGGAEGELLLSPNMEFVVTKELHTPREGALDGSRVIEMQQIPDATLWS